MDQQGVELLSQALPCGLYAGEDIGMFNSFLSTVDTILQGSAGPRADIITAISIDEPLHRQIQHFDSQWSWPPGSTNVNRLFDLDSLHKKLFPNHYNLVQMIPKFETAVQRVSQIREQLSKAKKTDPESIIRERTERLQKARAELAQLEQDAELQRFMKVLQRIDEYRVRWHTCNLELGQTSQSKGEQFEGRRQQVICQISQRGYNVQNYWTNLYWNDQKSLGEVDLLLQTDQGWVIVEFKARIFDVMSAFLQNGPERDPEKQWLTIPDSGTRVILDNTVPIFIITTLPEHPYVLPMESELKRVITYRVKHPDEELITYARTIIAPNRLRPVDWYIGGGYQYVIILR